MRWEARGYDDPEVSALIAALQQEYVRRYGTQDETEVDAAEFAPPHGVLLLGLRGGTAVAMGGWRPHAPGVVEIKRMYVPEAMRRRGLARLMLAALEARAAAAGAHRVVLNTGLEQPEAVAVYHSAGYRPIDGYGFYADAPLALFFAKELVPKTNPPAVP